MKNVEAKLDKIAEDIAEIKVIQAEQAADLKHHIYRTDLNEETIQILRKQVEPVLKSHERINGVLKFFGAIAVVAGIVKAVVEVVNLLS